MRAAILKELGTIPDLGDFTEPVAAQDEELVTVSAAAIKPLERAIAAGRHYSSRTDLPIVCGIDGVGRREDGEPVYFMVLRRPFGAMAERAPASLTVPIPAGLDDALAAAVVNPAIAAWLPLVCRAAMKPGETVVIPGATGAAGRMAVAAARLLGAGRVVACGRRQDVLAELGADATIDLAQPEDGLASAFAAIAAEGVGVVVDYVWGQPARLLINALGSSDLVSRGDEDVRFVSTGAMAGDEISLPSAALRGSRIILSGSGTGNFPSLARLKLIIADILDHARSGHLPMRLARHPFEALARVWNGESDPDLRSVLIVS